MCFNRVSRVLRGGGSPYKSRLKGQGERDEHAVIESLLFRNRPAHTSRHDVRYNSGMKPTAMTTMSVAGVGGIKIASLRGEPPP